MESKEAREKSKLKIL